MAVGILAFLLPTRFADIGGTSALEKELTGVRAELDEVRLSAAGRESDVYDSRERVHLQLPLVATLAQLRGAADEDLAALVRGGSSVFAAKLLPVAVQTAEALAEPDGGAVRLDLTDVLPVPYRRIEYAPLEVSAEARAAVGRGAAEAGLKPGDLLKKLEKLREDIRGGTGSVSSAAVLREALTPYEGLFKSSHEEYLALREKLDRAGGAAERRTRRVLDLERRERELEEALRRQTSENAGVSVWLPVLGVRVLIVVLLLYVTRILLATYRYSVSISAFYASRADSLQMVGDRPDGSVLDTDEYDKLTGALTPSHAVDPVLSPDETLGNLFKMLGK